MSRTPARHTQPDSARAIRATKQAGGGVVELVPDGTIRISVISTTDNADVQLEPEQEVVL